MGPHRTLRRYGIAAVLADLVPELLGLEVVADPFIVQLFSVLASGRLDSNVPSRIRLVGVMPGVSVRRAAAIAERIQKLCESRSSAMIASSPVVVSFCGCDPLRQSLWGLRPRFASASSCRYPVPAVPPASRLSDVPCRADLRVRGRVSPSSRSSSRGRDRWPLGLGSGDAASGRCPSGVMGA